MKIKWTILNKLPTKLCLEMCCFEINIKETFFIHII